MTNKFRMAVLVLASALATSNVDAEKLSFFRSDRGLAPADGPTLPEQLDAPGALRWRQELPSGHSTPCVYGGRIFVTTFDGQQLATVGLDGATGKVLWQHVAPAKGIEKYHPTGSPAASTPACDGQRVYVFFGSYGLLCYDLDGKLLWSKPLGPFQDEFGSASSPILAGGKLILNEDHDLNSYVLAVDPADGRTIWQTLREGVTRSYATPILWTVAGRPQLVVAGALELTGYDLDTGRPLWTRDGFARIVNTTPVADNELLYVATWSPGGDNDARVRMEPWAQASVQWDKDHDGKLTREEVNNPDVLDRFFRIDLNQDQGIDEKEWTKYASVFDRAQNVLMALRPGVSDSAGPAGVAWEYRKGLPYVSSPLVYRGVVYLVKDGGIVTTLDAATGKVLKQARARSGGGYYASPVAGDGKVYLASDKGVITVLKAAGQWEILASHDLVERICATPVIQDGRIYVRSEKAVYCYARGKEGP